MYVESRIFRFFDGVVGASVSVGVGVFLDLILCKVKVGKFGLNMVL